MGAIIALFIILLARIVIGFSPTSSGYLEVDETAEMFHVFFEASQPSAPQADESSERHAMMDCTCLITHLLTSSSTLAALKPSSPHYPLAARRAGLLIALWTFLYQRALFYQQGLEAEEESGLMESSIWHALHRAANGDRLQHQGWSRKNPPKRAGCRARSLPCPPVLLPQLTLIRQPTPDHHRGELRREVRPLHRSLYPSADPHCKWQLVQPRPSPTHPGE